MGHYIIDYKEYKGVPISRDFNVADGQQVYIGNGQGCNTFWFASVGEARKFIDFYEKKIKVNDMGIVDGLIPRKIHLQCRSHYSYGTRAWKNRTRENCSDIKEQIKAKVAQ